MNWIIILIIVIVVAIIVLSGKSLTRKRTREEFLEELSKFLETRIEPLEGYQNSFKINFKFKGQDFEFQDVEYQGFKTNDYKAYLRTKTKSDLTINFTEQPKSGIKTDIVQSSQIGKGNLNTVTIPKALKKFAVYTNDVKMTNQLFDNDSVLGILSRYQYVDARGHPVMPVRIQDGNIALEFDMEVIREPNLFDLRHNVSKIDMYLNKVLVLTKAVNALHDKKSK